MRFTRKGNYLFRPFATLAIASILLACSVPALAGDLSRAEELFNRAQYSASVSLLSAHAKDAASLFLLGRDHYMLAEFKKASEFLEKAVDAQAQNSEYLDWLGRAYGKRAETSNPLSAMGLASKARQAFERAVQANSKDTDALSDLFHYYLEAPRILGGGYDKAASVAEKMSAVDPAEGFFEQAELAQKRRQFQTAESELRRSVALGPKETGHLIALAKLLAKEGQTAESDAMFREAEQIDPNAPKVWLARAGTLIKEKRNLPEAKTLLQKYINAPITSDDPPRQEAFDLLKQANGA
jgi:tetratricopeptide (TPR) repeat protein